VSEALAAFACLARRAARSGLEGLVSKPTGRSKHWVKIKNRSHPAMSQAMEAFPDGQNTTFYGHLKCMRVFSSEHGGTRRN
jgi:hypothetical protein